MRICITVRSLASHCQELQRQQSRHVFDETRTTGIADGCALSGESGPRRASRQPSMSGGAELLTASGRTVPGRPLRRGLCAGAPHH
jgi:hypothetical protein